MAEPRRFTIATKLPLALASLLSVVVAVMAVAAYVEVRASALALVTDRTDQGARQIANLLGPAVTRGLAMLQAEANRPETIALLTAPSPAARAAALAHWQQMSLKSTVEVWNAARVPVLIAGPALPPVPPDEAARRADLARHGAAIGPFVVLDHAVIQINLAPAVQNGAVIGYFVLRERFGSAQQMAALTKLLGADARLLIGNVSGDLWTDFRTQVTGIPDDLGRSPGLAAYFRNTNLPVFAHAVPVPGTPWAVVLEVPQAPVLAPVRRFVARAVVLSVVLALGGATIGWGLSRRLTSPLRRMTAAAEAIATDRSSEHIDLHRGDELGRLAGAFDTMMTRLADERQRLKALAHDSRLLFLESPLPMWVLKRETLQIHDVNLAAIAHYGYGRDEFLSMSFTDVTDDPTSMGAMRSSVASEAVYRGASRHRAKTGRVIHTDMTWQDLTLDGAAATLVVAHDVTAELAATRALKESEDALRLVNADLEHRVEVRTAALQTANHELEAFSYSVSHDLRTPLRAISGFSQVLLEDYADALPPDARQHLDVIARNTRTMGQLIDDLLTFSRLSRQPMARARTDMTALVSASVQDIQRAEPHRSFEFVLDVLPPADAARSLVKHVIDNLIQNAAKFTRTRPVARIEIGHITTQDQTVYFVRDNGVGFEMQYADKLFGVFQRLHRAADFEGTGVGLAIVHRIVSRHGGRVWADSVVDQGATFFFTLAEPQASRNPDGDRVEKGAEAPIGLTSAS